MFWRGLAAVASTTRVWLFFSVPLLLEAMSSICSFCNSFCKLTSLTLSSWASRLCFCSVVVIASVAVSTSARLFFFIIPLALLPEAFGAFEAGVEA